MVLARRSLAPASRVLIIDDFMQAGGTVSGMINLLAEFDATPAGIGVFVEAKDVKKRLVDDYLSLLQLAAYDEVSRKIHVEKGSYFDTPFR